MRQAPCRLARPGGLAWDAQDDQGPQAATRRTGPGHASINAGAISSGQPVRNPALSK